MSRTLKFFCAECGAKFEAPFYVTEMQRGRKIISSECACPKCGCWNSYSDTAEGHADELRHALDYEDELFRQEAADDDE